MKNFSLISAVCTVFLLTACSDGLKSDKSIYGDLPKTIEKVEKELSKEVQSLKGKDMDVESALGMIMTLNQKLDEKTAESREKLIGTTLPYELSDSLPYTICSDITVTNVELTKKQEVRMYAEFDVEFTEPVELEAFGNKFKICYFVTGESGPFYVEEDRQDMKDVEITQKPDEYGGTWPYWILNPGDKIHARINFTAKEIPVMYLCERLKFIPEKQAREAHEETSLNRFVIMEKAKEK
ncbi:MAG: hypothetical protein IJT97_11650 [Bacteroidaceae bacterium]|nr:hypothetical protein [Bacteroidaceae bacterium]